MNIPSNKKQFVLALGVALTGLGIALVLMFSKPDTPAAEKREEQAGAKRAERADMVLLTDAQLAQQDIGMAAAGPASIDASTTMTGTIRFNEDRTAHVVPRLAGVVEAVHADLGQHVKKGQVLVAIASVALAEQRSALFTAQNRLSLAITTFEREKKLWQDRISAEQDYLQARQSMQEAQIEERNARQKLAALGVPTGGAGPLNIYQLRAPFDGVIVEKHVAPGESVKEDANIFTISDLSTVWAEIAVPASQLDDVRVGAKATIRAASSATQASGAIAYVGELLGEQTRTAKARVVLGNPDGAWRPGLFVAVAITARESKVALAVPVKAIHTVEGKPTVFVRVEQGFAVRHIETGKSDGRMAEVRAGLKGGEQVAARGSFIVKAELGKSGAEHSH